MFHISYVKFKHKLLGFWAWFNRIGFASWPCGTLDVSKGACVVGSCQRVILLSYG